MAVRLPHDNLSHFDLLYSVPARHFSSHFHASWGQGFSFHARLYLQSKGMCMLSLAASAPTILLTEGQASWSRERVFWKLQSALPEGAHH